LCRGRLTSLVIARFLTLVSLLVDLLSAIWTPRSRRYGREVEIAQCYSWNHFSPKRKTNVCRDDIVLCHDIAPITHPEFYSPLAGPSYDKAYRRIQRAAPAVVFVSEFTKAQFLERFPADYRRCLVIPLYFKSTLFGQWPTRPNTKPFILMVGTLESRKNYKMALEAFARSGLTDRGYDLVIVGPRGNLSREFLPLILANDRIKHLGFVSDAQLKELYATATALFFPSLVEGFGVPALEAPQSDLLPFVS
jgi:glycosyltransferase involved in cell wall biosynthesis